MVNILSFSTLMVTVVLTNTNGSDMDMLDAS